MYTAQFYRTSESYAVKSRRPVDNKFLDIYTTRTATARVDVWTSKDIMYRLILSEASHLKPPAGGKLPWEELECSRTTACGRDLHFCAIWEAEEPGQCSALAHPA